MIAATDPANDPTVDDAQPLDALLLASDAALWLVDGAEPRRVRASRGATVLLGRDADATAAALLEPATFRRAATDAGTDLAPVRALRDGRAARDDVEVVRGDGTRVPVSLEATPLATATGRVAGVLVVAMDQSALQGALDSLRAEDHRKDEFLAKLGHELRNPLAPIRTAVQLLRMPRTDAARAKDLIDITERQVVHMVRLIDLLTDFAKLNLGGMALRRERTDLATVVDNAVGMSLGAIGAAGHALDVRLPEKPMPLDGDALRLSQVVAQVLDNAAKFTDHGGRIEVRVEREGRLGVVRVRDTGGGIAPESMASIFTPFVRGSRTSSHAPSGLGLGLALARRLAEMHGGELTASSPGEGHGSEFVLRVPLE